MHSLVHVVGMIHLYFLKLKLFFDQIFLHGSFLEIFLACLVQSFDKADYHPLFPHPLKLVLQIADSSAFTGNCQIYFLNYVLQTLFLMFFGRSSRMLLDFFAFIKTFCVFPLLLDKIPIYDCETHFSLNDLLINADISDCHIFHRGDIAHYHICPKAS
jgi:hypothetical protein